MKKFILGLVLGLAIAIPVGAHAEVTSLINQVVQGMFPVTIDGKSLGNAIVVDNKTYLPVRDFGEAVGYKVTFTDAQQVVLTKNQVTPQPTPDPVTTPTTSVTTGPSKAEKINSLTSNIASLKDYIAINKSIVDGAKKTLNDPLTSEERKPSLNQRIQQLEQENMMSQKKLNDLETQLSQLESTP